MLYTLAAMKKNFADSPKTPRYRAQTVGLRAVHSAYRITSGTLHSAAVFAIGMAFLAALPLASAGGSKAESAQTAGRLFVCNTLSDTVSVVDDASGTVIANIPVGHRP